MTPIRPAPSLSLGKPGSSDAGMEDGFKLPTLRLVGKDARCQCLSAQAPTGVQHIGPKPSGDLGQRGLPWLHKFASNDI